MPERMSDYDLARIEEAKKLLTKVYEYYYGSTPFRPHVKRLETILKKLEELKNLETKA